MHPERAAKYAGSVCVITDQRVRASATDAPHAIASIGAAIAAALTAHRDVRDAAVLAYPDRITGTGLYAFVEARHVADAERPSNENSRLDEAKLLAHVAATVGRENAPTCIQIVPALPRNADGHVRTDILQLIATNQVDSIDALITSEAERATVDCILNARQNMRDRFVL